MYCIYVTYIYIYYIEIPLLIYICFSSSEYVCKYITYVLYICYIHIYYVEIAYIYLCLNAYVNFVYTKPLLENLFLKFAM